MLVDVRRGIGKKALVGDAIVVDNVVYLNHREGYASECLFSLEMEGRIVNVLFQSETNGFMWNMVVEKTDISLTPSLKSDSHIILCRALRNTMSIKDNSDDMLVQGAPSTSHSQHWRK